MYFCSCGQHTSALVSGRILPVRQAGVHVRPVVSRRMLLRAGGIVHVLAQALRQYVQKPVVMLDLCAAPGGKSTLARSVLPEGSLLVANEVMRNRSQVLAENLVKWGNPEVMVTNNDPADFTELGPLFDVILTDVPCSGEGMFRKDEVAVQEWSIANVDTCWQRQRRILRDIWPCLKTGGLLVYSTCTYNREENEDNVAWIAQELGAEVLPLEVKPEWHITGNLTEHTFPVYRFLPHKTTGEGLFLAVLRKTSEEDRECARVKPAGKSPKKEKEENTGAAGAARDADMDTRSRRLRIPCGRDGSGGFPYGP